MNRFITSETPAHSQSGELDVEDVRFYIKPLSEDAAFNKGVEWGSDIVFLYSLILFIGLYEIYKNYEKEEKAR